MTPVNAKKSQGFFGEKNLHRKEKPLTENRVLNLSALGLPKTKILLPKGKKSPLFFAVHADDFCDSKFVSEKTSLRITNSWNQRQPCYRNH